MAGKRVMQGRTHREIVFVSAWNDSGGAFLTRLLDGHRQVLTFPYELQLGTQPLEGVLGDWFAAKYRWPTLPTDARDSFDAFANEELYQALGAGPGSKFERYRIEIDMQRWRER